MLTDHALIVVLNLRAQKTRRKESIFKAKSLSLLTTSTSKKLRFYGTERVLCLLGG